VFWSMHDKIRSRRGEFVSTHFGRGYEFVREYVRRLETGTFLPYMLICCFLIMNFFVCVCASILSREASRVWKASDGKKGELVI
jgi:hypothetical protein